LTTAADGVGHKPAVPELPDITVYTERLADKVQSRAS